MTQQRRVKGLGALKRQLKKDLTKLDARVVEATHKAADYGRLVAYSKAPVAFGELRDGIVDARFPRGAAILSTAPHSVPAEIGSRPHMPPIEPILKWVRLRGAQGVAVGEGATGHPGRVARMIRARGTETSTPVDAAERVAWAIALAIKKHGTKPSWFMKQTVPEVQKLLDGLVKTLFREDL